MENIQYARWWREKSGCQVVAQRSENGIIAFRYSGPEKFTPIEVLDSNFDWGLNNPYSKHQNPKKDWEAALEFSQNPVSQYTGKGYVREKIHVHLQHGAWRGAGVAHTVSQFVGHVENASYDGIVVVEDGEKKKLSYWQFVQAVKDKDMVFPA